MIVKDEATVIRRCLQSVRPLIDHWVVVDTGSMDGTQDIVRDALKGVPGRLYERPWKDFAQNRTEALTLARTLTFDDKYATYILLIDADDVLEIPDGFEVPKLVTDSYVFDIHLGTLRYQRIQLVRSSLDWRYRGVLHEFIVCDGAGPSGHLPLVMQCYNDGKRRNDPDKYRHDAAVLEKALVSETDPFMRARYIFYLAQSYRDNGDAELALKNYLTSANVCTWREERYVSLLNAARLMEKLKFPTQNILDIYVRATNMASIRAEALYEAARLCRLNNRFEEGYQFAKRGVQLPAPKGALFIEQWIYDYGLLDEISVNGYWSGHYRESLEANERILEENKFPENQRQRFQTNLGFIQRRNDDVHRTNSE